MILRTRRRVLPAERQRAAPSIEIVSECDVDSDGNHIEDPGLAGQPNGTRDELVDVPAAIPFSAVVVLRFALLGGGIKDRVARKGGGRTSRAAALFVIGMVLSLAVGRSAAARGPEQMSRRPSARASAGLITSNVPTCLSFVDVSTFSELQDAVGVDSACIDVQEDITFTSHLSTYANMRIASSVNATLNGGGSTQLFQVHNGYLALDNLTLAHGYDPVNGGAVHVEVDGRLDASRCTFKYSKAGFDGGALDNYGTVDLSHCAFIDNAATLIASFVRSN